MAASPLCTVQDGAAAPVTTPNGVDVTAGNVQTVTLVSTAGVNNWSLTVIGQDDAVTPPVIAVNPTTKIATFTAPAGPWSMIFKSVVNNGINLATGLVDPSLTSTFKMSVKTVGTLLRLGASNETLENNATLGWVKLINDAIRAAGSGGGGVSLAGDLLGTGSIAATPRVGGLTGIGGVLALAATAASVVWNSAAVTPSIGQQNTSGSPATSLSVSAQTSTGVASTGGALNLNGGGGLGQGGAVNVTSGSGAGVSTAGAISFTAGAQALGAFKAQGAQDWTVQLDAGRTNWIFNALGGSQNIFLVTSATGKVEVDSASFIVNNAAAASTTGWLFTQVTGGAYALTVRDPAATSSVALTQTASATNGGSWTITPQAGGSGFGGALNLNGAAGTTVGGNVNIASGAGSTVANNGAIKLTSGAQAMGTFLSQGTTDWTMKLDAGLTNLILFASQSGQNVFLESFTGTVCAFAPSFTSQSFAGVLNWTMSNTAAGGSPALTMNALTSVYSILQADQTATTVGQTLTIHAQNNTNVTPTDGGKLVLSGGTCVASTTTTYGNVAVQSPFNIGILGTTGVPLTPSAGANALSALQSSNNVVNIGTQASAFTLTFARRIADTSLLFVRNPSGNGLATISYLTGGTVTVAAATSALIVSDGSNLKVIMIGT